jgi:outer membrane protein assembly factor BamB
MLVGVLLVLVVLAVSVWFFFFVWPALTGSHLSWRQAIVQGFDNFGTATYESGMLYAPSKGDNRVYALEASSGRVVWSHTVRQCDGSPCIDGDVIYVGECSGPDGEPTPAPEALALNRLTGEVVWSFVEPNDTPWVGSPVVNGGLVYYTTLGTGVYALNKTDGTPVWHQNIGKVVCSAAYDSGLVFVSAYDPQGQYAFNATSGITVWREEYGSSWDSSPVVYEGMVIQVAVNDANVTSTYVLNETTGELIRSFVGGGGQSTPLVCDGKIFIPSQNCRIWAYDLATGMQLWHTAELTIGTPELRKPEVSYCSPALVDGTIYYQSLSGTFYAIDEASGTVRWSRELGDGHVFITNDDALYAFEIGSTNTDWPMFCRNNLHQSYAD